MTIRIFTTGGTFDKLYFDAESEFHIGDTMAGEMLEEANVNFEYRVESILKKDSLDMDEQDREVIRKAVVNAQESKILVIHGTDGMIDSAQALLGITDKTIVLLGAMQPARMRYSDAPFNLGFASAAVQLLAAGTYIAMNGEIFDPIKVAKNRAHSRFELTGQ